ncbi:SRPBCC family protein [soil metagenome]
MRILEPTDLAFFETAPARITGRAQLSAPPERVFASLADPSEWLKWFPKVKTIGWTKGTGGLGSEREVRLGGGLGVYRERFIAWEPARRFSFTMYETSSLFVTHLAEDFRLSSEGTGTQVDWVMAGKLTVLGHIAWPVMRALMSSFFRRGTRKLETVLVG